MFIKKKWTDEQFDNCVELETKTYRKKFYPMT